MEAGDINGLAIVGAAVCSFLIGAFWYSNTLFGKIWLKQTGLTEQKVKEANFGRLFGFTFIFQLILATFIALAGAVHNADVVTGLYVGAGAGIMIFCGIAVAYLFAQRSWSLIYIDGGYQIIAATIMGILIGYF